MKKIIIGLICILTLTTIIILLIMMNSHKANHINVKFDKDEFKFSRNQVTFSATTWELYINNDEIRVCSFVPHDGLSSNGMSEFVKSQNVIEKIYDKEDVRIYRILLYVNTNQTNTYPAIVYTINGTDFYCWNDENDENRLIELYEHFSEIDFNNLINITPKLWER